ncbi:MAG: ATP-binding protein [Desulfobacteraceae bacterium]|nr:ATP-binding protein [Desulfobacteraceae bacterium]
MRFFNTAGPVDPGSHYCLPSLHRIDPNHIELLIEEKKYFVMYAPWQSGKTSYLLTLMKHLNDTGKYHCLYFNLEVGQSARENVLRGVKAILSEMATCARVYLNDDFPEKNWADILGENGEDAAFGKMLTLWAEQSRVPLVLLIDKIDTLAGDTLISILRQLRAGYTRRPGAFPQSVLLCGICDIRDYRIRSSKENAVITGGTAFNIKAEALRMEDFTKDEMTDLYRQHTIETGQVFSDEAFDEAWEFTQGQPWLVNALGYESCFKIEETRDRTREITWETINQSAENIIRRRDTHIEQLADVLWDKQVQKIIEPILIGKSFDDGLNFDDVQYVKDLGLVKDQDGKLAIANGIYEEAIPRELSWTVQMGIQEQAESYQASDGRLDMDKLMSAFQDFFKNHSEQWIGKFEYKEAAPLLLIQAFLQHIIRKNGRMKRNYGLGMKHTDILVTWHYNNNIQKIFIGLKFLHDFPETPLSKDVKQTREYVKNYEADEGHLVIFDRTPDRSWDLKLSEYKRKVRGKRIRVWGM